MNIHQLELLNFGIYEGEQIFNLTPEPCNGFNRPIILLRGKNGAGKTTLVEAIRLCLHGSLVLGNRVSRSVYEDYLAKHIHTPKNSNNHPTSAKVALLLDYVSVGQKKTYRVERKWEVVQGNVKEDVYIWEDGQALTDLENREQRDSFLRELAPPGVADLFFFDSEKLHTLAEGNSSDLLADTVKALLGLNLVEQLQKDLDIYLSRQRSDHGRASLQDQLYELTQGISSLERKRLGLQSDQRTNAEAIAKKWHAIAEQEQRIASEGSWFAERLEELKITRQRLEVEIEIQRRRAQELANGLLPFAITPHMCLSVAERLRLEAKYEQGMAAQQVLASQLEQVSTELASPEFWADIGISIDEATKRKISSKVESVLSKQTVQSSNFAAEEIILRVSEQDQQTLLNWIEQSRTQAPREFCQTINQLDALEEKLQKVDQEMQLVPADETLNPLVEVLHRYNQELGALQKTAEDLAEQIRRSEYELEQMGYRRQRLRQQIVEQEQNNQRVQLVDKVQFALKEYADDLSRGKIALLGKRLADRFNDLCRKEDLVDAIRIDPETFAIILYRQQQPWELEQLSAGERQLLALAIMWALREVSGVPMPVIVDTPLGRLDSDHRLSMVQNYLPRVSHQVILLATDTEVDDQVLSQLQPAISHVYYLDYNPSQGKTVVHEGTAVNTSAQEKVVVS